MLSRRTECPTMWVNVSWRIAMVWMMMIYIDNLWAGIVGRAVSLHEPLWFHIACHFLSTYPQLVSSICPVGCKEAIPKSAILMFFSRSSSRFSGFKSRWLYIQQGQYDISPCVRTDTQPENSPDQVSMAVIQSNDDLLKVFSGFCFG